MSADPTNDTHPKIEALLIEGYRKMSPAQKLERAADGRAASRWPAAHPGTVAAVLAS